MCAAGRLPQRGATKGTKLRDHKKHKMKSIFVLFVVFFALFVILLNCHRLGEVPWLIDITPTTHRDVIREQL